MGFCKKVSADALEEVLTEDEDAPGGLSRPCPVAPWALVVSWKAARSGAS